MKPPFSNLLIVALAASISFSLNAQTVKPIAGEGSHLHKFSAGTTWLTFLNFGKEETNTRHYEFHFGYRLTPKDKIGIKAATWELFAPMGIPSWDPLFLDESGFYPGRIRERGIGVTYQRILWKGLFASVEIYPLWKTYLDENREKIDSGFKLYTTGHLGYHFSLFKDRLYIDPQVHCNYWPVDSKGPLSFEEKESTWKNYFLFEPNLYIGLYF